MITINIIYSRFLYLHYLPCNSANIIIFITTISIFLIILSLHEMFNKGSLIPIILQSYALIICHYILLTDMSTVCNKSSSMSLTIVIIILLMITIVCAYYMFIYGSLTIVRIANIICHNNRNNDNDSITIINSVNVSTIASTSVNSNSSNSHIIKVPSLNGLAETTSLLPVNRNDSTFTSSSTSSSTTTIQQSSSFTMLLELECSQSEKILLFLLTSLLSCWIGVLLTDSGSFDTDSLSTIFIYKIIYELWILLLYSISLYSAYRLYYKHLQNEIVEDNNIV